MIRVGVYLRGSLAGAGRWVEEAVGRIAAHVAGERGLRGVDRLVLVLLGSLWDERSLCVEFLRDAFLCGLLLVRRCECVEERVQERGSRVQVVGLWVLKEVVVSDFVDQVVKFLVKALQRNDAFPAGRVLDRVDERWRVVSLVGRDRRWLLQLGCLNLLGSDLLGLWLGHAEPVELGAQVEKKAL